MVKVSIKLAGLVIGALLLAVATATLVKHELTRYATGTHESYLSYLSPTALWLTELPKKLLQSLTPYTTTFLVPSRFAGQIGFEGDTSKEERYLLLSRFDGEAAKGVVDLIDLRTFEVKQTWKPHFRAYIDTWNQRELELDRPPQLLHSHGVTGHPVIVGDGLVFNTPYSAMQMVDVCHRLVWQSTPSSVSRFHHSIEVDIDGNIWSIAAFRRQFDPVVIGSTKSRPFLDDAIIKLNRDGEVLFDKSISDILEENGLGHLVWGRQDSAYTNDWLHANDVQPANSDTEYWKKGDVLVSLRTPSLVFLYRPSTNDVLWHSFGYVYRQHDPDFVDESRVSIFDNNTPYRVERTPPVDQSVEDETVWSDGHSQVIVYDFATKKYSSYFDEVLHMHEVRSPTQGRSEILPNGELFLEETDYGRVLYFNADGSLRWSYVNGTKDGNTYALSWSRILYREHEISTVRDFLERKDQLLAACGKP